MFLMWFDDDKRKLTTDKITEALAAYERRFRSKANVVLVHEQERGDAPNWVTIRAQSYIRPSMFYVGREDA